MRKPNGDLLSVTQKDEVPLKLGQKVLLIAGNQARIVPDYTVTTDTQAKETPSAPAQTAPASGRVAETPPPAPSPEPSPSPPADPTPASTPPPAEPSTPP